MHHPEFFFVLGSLLLGSCFWFYGRPARHFWGLLVLLFLGSLSIRWGFHAYYPQLQLWDEQFHALVAKNMGENWLHPKLYFNHVYPFDYTLWVSNETWLHKQPWFLWQMALSIKAFGNEVWAVRLPSLVMASLLPLVVFDSVRILLGYKSGVIASVLTAAAFYLSWWASGFKPTDHNDIAFIFYVTLGCWAVFRYTLNKNLIFFSIAMAFFVGVAVLNKWLIGLFPLLIFGLWGLLEFKKNRKILPLLHLILVTIGVTAIVLPWQWYIHQQFPKEATWEAAYNARHFFEVLEYHERPWHFYFSSLSKLFLYPGRSFGWLVLLPALIYGVFRVCFSNQLWRAYTLSTLFVLLFFTLAATKMPGFTYLLAPFFFGITAKFFSDVYDFFNIFLKRSPLKTSISFFLLSGLVYVYAIPVGEVDVRNNHSNRFFEGRNGNYPKLLTVEDYLPDFELPWVIFNTIKFEDIILMFHAKEKVTAYSRIPTGNDIHIAHEKGYRIAVVQQEGQQLPEYITENERIIVLPIVFRPHAFY